MKQKDRTLYNRLKGLRGKVASAREEFKSFSEVDRADVAFANAGFSLVQRGIDRALYTLSSPADKYKMIYGKYPETCEEILTFEPPKQLPTIRRI